MDLEDGRSCKDFAMLKVVIAVCVIFVCVEGVQVPSYFPKCKKDDANRDECIKNSANAGLATFVKGDPSAHVVPLNPLHVNEMFIDVDGNLKINLTNSDIHGLEDTVFESFKWNFDNKKILFDARIPKADLIGTYDISGRILILPINGIGPCNITYVNGLFKFEYSYEIEERKGKEYVNVIDGKMTYEADRIYFKLDNLFGGDPKLGEEMSKFLDENWKEVNGEIGLRVGDALCEVFLNIIKSMLSRIPESALWE